MANQTTANAMKGSDHEVADLTFNGLSFGNRVAKTADYTATVLDFLIAYTTLAAGRTLTLPAAASCAGRVFIVKDESGNAGTNNITVDGNASETIDGATTKAISANYGVLRLYCTGTAWFTF